MDTDHGHTDRPGGVPDTEAEVGVVCGLVLAFLHMVDDFGEVAEYVVFEGLRMVRSEIGNQFCVCYLLALFRNCLKSGFRYSAVWA